MYCCASTFVSFSQNPVLTNGLSRCIYMYCKHVLSHVMLNCVISSLKVFVLNIKIGTGKSVTGAHLAFAFALLNKAERKPQLMKRPCVLYCGPSNKSVEVVLSEHAKKPIDMYIAIPL